MIESVLNMRERVAEMPTFVMKLRRFIGKRQVAYLHTFGSLRRKFKDFGVQL